MSYQYVHGVEQVIRDMEQFPVKVQTRVVKGALRAGAHVIRAAARHRAPRRSGLLASTVRVMTRTRGRAVTATVKVGTRRRGGGGAYYAHMVMGGTRPHIIKARPGGLLGFGGFIVRKVQHPGTKAQPFLDEAVAATREQAFFALFAYANAEIRKLVPNPT